MDPRPLPKSVASDSGDHLPRQAAYLRAINRFALSMIQIAREEPLVWYAAREVVRRMGFVDCVIYLYDDQRGVLVQRAAIGDKNPEGDEILNPLEIPVGSGITGTVAATLEPMIVSDLRREPRYIPDVNAAVSEICVPLVFDGGLLGVIDCEDPRVDHFSPEHLEILTTVAAMLSAKIVQCRGRDRLQASVVQLERAETKQQALLSIASISHASDDPVHVYRSIHRAVGTLLNADNVGFCLHRRSSNCLEFPYRAREGEQLTRPLRYEADEIDDLIPMYAIRRNEPLLLDRAAMQTHIAAGDFKTIHDEPESWLSVPFDIDADTRGLIFVESRQVGSRYTETDKELLAYVLHQIGAAVARKLAREALEDSEARFARAVAGSNDGIWDWNIETNEKWFSDRWCQIVGYRREQLEPTHDAYLDLIHPGDRQQVLNATKGHLEKGEAFDVELRLRHRDGQYVWVRSRGQAVWGPDGAPTRMAGSISDMTEQIAAEAQLRQAQKMEAVGQLTGGIAHDFNNRLTVISGNLELSLREVQGEPAEPYLREALAATTHSADLVKQLLAFARQSRQSRVIVDAGDSILNTAALLRRTLGDKIRIETPAGDPCPVSIDPAQFESALLNLAINARDAMPSGGTLRIETRVGNFPQAQLPGSGAGVVRIVVSDDGHGIPEEVRQRVLEPFFTTKDVGKGTGLGLSMVYGFVQQCGGSLRIDSVEGSGTSVVIYLPLAEAPARAETVTVPATEESPNRKRVLVVEDDDGVRRVVVRHLESLGYRVVEASNGGEAMRALEQSQHPDIVLSDIVLPGGMDGTQIVSRARDMVPGVAVLLMSGYPGEGDGVGIDVPILSKPFNEVDLARALRECVAAA